MLGKVESKCGDELRWRLGIDCTALGKVLRSVLDLTLGGMKKVEGGTVSG